MLSNNGDDFKDNSTLTLEISSILNLLDLKNIKEVETRIAQITPLVESENYLTIADLNILAPFVIFFKTTSYIIVIYI